jgi:two-component system chemotaxis response regulator CheB
MSERSQAQAAASLAGRSRARFVAGGSGAAATSSGASPSAIDPGPARLIAIGASLGGLAAVGVLLRGLPARLGVGIVLAQHRRPDPQSRLVDLLAHDCALPVLEPEDRSLLEPDRVYLAPADYHLLVEPGVLALSIDPPVNFARPSIDVLFESVADAYGPAAIGVMLTNSNEDGAEGARAIKRAGGCVLVQDPARAESPIGPRATLALTPVDAVLDLPELAAELQRLCRLPA